MLSPWLFSVYWMMWCKRSMLLLGKRLELLHSNDSWFANKELSYADDTVLVADSEEKLVRLVSEFGRVCERTKLHVNVGKNKFMRCFRYVNAGQMGVRQNGKMVRGSGLFKVPGVHK